MQSPRAAQQNDPEKKKGAFSGFICKVDVTNLEWEWEVDIYIYILYTYDMGVSENRGTPKSPF